ncbi:MAG: hypothetical protein Q4A32_01235 [Lachnospiraceae bacterium]|nr:hypothetical protein [Lachnospiraceae bacterium]
MSDDSDINTPKYNSNILGVLKIADSTAAVKCEGMFRTGHSFR